MVDMIPRSARVPRRVTAIGALSVVMLIGQLTLAGPAAAAPYTGGFSPTVIGQLADLNGDGVVTGRDDANAFYGDTHIIDGRLDCGAWTVANDGTGGSGTIGTGDDCTLIGYDGTPGGVTIEVEDGEFHWDGPLPFVFNAADPDNPDVSESDFAWSTIGGRVDSNGDEAVDEDDCHFGLIGETVDAGLGDSTDGADILGNDAGDTNPCGFAIPPDSANNGLVDLNSDGDITAADSCTDGCFFRHDVTLGVVQDQPIAPPSPPPGTYTGGFSPTIVSMRADLNGDGVVSGRDDANAFFGDTHIIDGQLDCGAWTVPNDGTGGSGTIGPGDDCTLIGYDGTPDGVTIEVIDGEFQWDGPLPFVFNASDPDNPDVSDSDFAWSAIDGRVDSNGDEAISVDDCHFGLIGETVDAGLGDPTDGADILGNDAANTNPCGFANPPDSANNGLVDLNSDGDITAVDSCAACFFGLEVKNGFVMAPAVATTLDLTPATDTNPEDTPHTVTAHVEDQDGDPMVGVTVRFSVTGANTASGTGITNASGNATFTYTGANPGTDTITSFADSNGNATQDPGEPSDTASKTWQAVTVPTPPPPPPPPGGLTCAGRAATHVGTNGNDTIVGTSGNDVIVALGGNDKVRSIGAADVVCAGAGKDTVRAGSGNDLVLGQGGNDFLLGQGAKDRINGGGGRDRIKGGSGRDTLRGQGANDTVRGQGGADKLNGGPGRDLCNGGAGTDTATACEKEQLIP